MTRNWDVIREVLSEIEALTPSKRETFSYSSGDLGDSDLLKVEHAKLLLEAGFIRGVTTSTLSGFGLLSPELTWAGHDLLDTIRSKDLWEKVKATAREKGIELSFDAVKILAANALKGMLGGG